MKSNNKPIFISASIFILYVIWLFSIVSRVTQWPTPRPLFLAMAPFAIIMIGFISIPIVAFLRGVSEGMSSATSAGSIDKLESKRFSLATIFCLLFGLACGGVFLYIEGSNNFNFSNRNKSESIIVKDESEKDVCIIHPSRALDQKMTENTACSFVMYPQIDDLAGNLTLKKTGRECIETAKKLCAEFCGNYLSQDSSDQVYGFLVNFGPRVNHDEFQLPFSSVRTLAAVLCNDDYNSNIRSKNEKKVINIKSFN